MANRRYGSDLIVDILQRYGIEYVSLNPGATFRGLHDSLVNYGNNRPEIIECPHEEIAVGLAQGYAKAAGKPMAAIVHDVVGLLHCCLPIYYSYLDRAPVLVLGATGPMDVARRRPHIDWTHTANLQGNAVRDYVKYDDQPFSADGIPDSFARAYRLAMTDPKGPVYLCYDAAIQEDPLDREIPLPDPSRAGPPAPPQGDRATLERIAEMLVAADHPVLIAEHVGRNPAGFDALVALAEALAAPVLDLNGRLNFPTRNPLNLSGDFDVLASADLVVGLDVRDLYWPISRLDRTTRQTTLIIPSGCRIATIGLEDTFISKWSVDFGKFQETDAAALADTALSLPIVLRRCQELLAQQPARRAAVDARRGEIAARHEALRARWRKEAEKDWDGSPIGTARLAHEVWEVIRDEDWVLTAGDLNGWAHRTWNFDKVYRHPGRSLGTATQISIALGVALAHRGSGKLVVDLQPDGDLMFDPGALWVAAKYQIPFLMVMYNNRAYYNDWEHQIRIARQRGTPEANAYVGMDIDKPAPDFASLARSLGVHAEGPIDKPEDVRGAVERALQVVKEGRPALVDTICQFR
jgi:acetolactate synthase I/II/III large subunit